MAHHWPNENTKWPTLEDLLLHLAQHDLVFQFKYYMISRSLLSVVQLTCNFWASLVLNENSYQKPWSPQLRIIVHHRPFWKAHLSILATRKFNLVIQIYCTFSMGESVTICCTNDFHIFILSSWFCIHFDLLLLLIWSLIGTIVFLNLRCQHLLQPTLV